MRIVFMGSPPFATPVFERIAASAHTIAALVTPPDRPKGRGRKLEPSPLAALARPRAIEVLQPESARDPAFVAALRALAPDAILVASYGEILKRDVLELAPLGAFNVHASLLPRHRGASPVQAAILHGDVETGVTVQRMVAALDEGDVVHAERTPIEPGETAGQLVQRLAQLGGVAALRALDQLERGDAQFTPQDPSLATYARKLSKEAGRIDWTRSAVDIERLVRAMTPWPGARTAAPDQSEIVVLKAHVHAERAARTEGAQRASTATVATALPQDAPPGSIVAQKNALVVATGDGLLEIDELKPSGRGAMAGAAWMRGVRLSGDARLGAS